MAQEKMNIARIAEDLNISKTTVSRAISGKGRVNPDTRARVLEYIRQHNYRPNLVAKGLAQNRTYNIALVVSSQFSSLDLAFVRKIMRSVYETAAQNDYDVIISMVGNQETEPVERLIINRKADGVILTRSMENDPLISLLQQRDVPFVVIGRNDAAGVATVDNDQVGGCCELTDYLLHKGMRRIALLGGSMNHTVNRSRLMGFRQAFADAGLELDEALLFLELESDVHRLRALELSLARRPDCIVCMDESLAMMALHVMKEQGIVVPDQVCLASMYDSKNLTEQEPQITAVQFDADALGRLAVRQLLKQLEGGPIDKVYSSGFQVVIRGSTMYRKR